MPEHISEDAKRLAVEYYLSSDEITQENVCDIFQCSRRSLMRC